MKKILIKYFRGSLKSIDDLRASEIITNWNKLKENSKERVSILVVDDEDFSPLEALKRNGFNIISLKDIDRLSQIEPFSIVLYDLQGVGLSLNSEMQGAHLIRETKKNYPEKYIIAYTGGSTDQRVQRAIIDANQYVSKDKPISDWVDLLDTAIDEVTNPVHVWKKFRSRLLNEGLNPFQLAILEDVFVKNYKQGPSVLNDMLIRTLNNETKNTSLLNPLLGSIITSSIKHLIYPQ